MSAKAKRIGKCIFDIHLYLLKSTKTDHADNKKYGDFENDIRQ